MVCLEAEQEEKKVLLYKIFGLWVNIGIVIV